MEAVALPLSNLRQLHHYGFATLHDNEATGQKSLHSTIHIYPGNVFATFESLETLPMANRFTVQVGEEEHVILSPSFLQYINHSCSPNMFFDTSKMELRCIRNIAPGDEFSFFYPSTEWDMAEPFFCFCGTNACLHEIRGAAHLTNDVIPKYQFTEFIQQKLHGSFLQKV